MLTKVQFVCVCAYISACMHIGHTHVKKKFIMLEDFQQNLHTISAFVQVHSGLIDCVCFRQIQMHKI